MFGEFVAKAGDAMLSAAVALAPLGCEGSTYEGGRSESYMREGHGEERLASGDCYTGEWRRGKNEGRGIFRFADGNVYEGQCAMLCYAMLLHCSDLLCYAMNVYEGQCAMLC